MEEAVLADTNLLVFNSLARKVFLDAVWRSECGRKTMAITEQFPTNFWKKSLQPCLSLVNGYLFLLEKLWFWRWPFGRLIILTPLSEPTLSRTKSRWYWRPVGQVHDAVRSNGSDQEPKCPGEQKASEVEDKGLLWTKCRPILNHSNGTSSICRCIPAKRDFQTAMLHLCWGWKLKIVLNISVHTWRDVPDLASMLVFHTYPRAIGGQIKARARS